MADNVLSEIRQPIRFSKKPSSVPPDYRPSWKVSLLLLILHLSSRGGKSSLTRLHVLNWAVRSGSHQDEFKRTRDSELPLFLFNVRFEPAFSKAIDLAAAATLVEWIGGNRIQITEVGLALAKKLTKQSDVLVSEKSFLTSIGKSLSEEQALKLAKGADIA